MKERYIHKCEYRGLVVSPTQPRYRSHVTLQQALQQIFGIGPGPPASPPVCFWCVVHSLYAHLSSSQVFGKCHGGLKNPVRRRAPFAPPVSYQDQKQWAPATTQNTKSCGASSDWPSLLGRVVEHASQSIASSAASVRELQPPLHLVT